MFGSMKMMRSAIRGTQGIRLLATGLIIAAGSAHAQSPQVTDSMAQRLRACTACHAASDQTLSDTFVPRLAGKPAAYLHEQLRSFQQGRRMYQPMQSLLAPLPDAYLADIARFFASQPVVLAPPTPLGDAALRTRGEALALRGDASAKVPACVSCHGAALTGVAGLPRNYLVAQLGAWRSGARQARSPDCMSQIARALDQNDLAAVAAWLASQPLPAVHDAVPLASLPAPPPMACGSIPAVAADNRGAVRP
jgi:cytochrome c553